MSEINTFPEDGSLVVVERLHNISTGIYRSSHPFPEHLGYLTKTLKIKTILTLAHPGKVERGPELVKSCEDSGITQYVVNMSPTNMPGGVSMEHMKEAMTILLDESKHPVLIHCKNGIHRTGLVVGVYQRLTSQLTIEDIHQGYDIVAEELSRAIDKEYLVNIDLESFEGCRVVATELEECQSNTTRQGEGRVHSYRLGHLARSETYPDDERS